MADQKDDYPKMPTKQWWVLRNRFRQSIPGTVTTSYLATVLDMEEISAEKNVLPALKRIGLIDQDGKPQEIAKRWRDDEEYPQVCEEIKVAVYPPELLDAVPDPINNRTAAIRWFSKSGAGKSLVSKRVAFYQLLCEADPQKGSESPKIQTGKSKFIPKSSIPNKTNKLRLSSPPNIASSLKEEVEKETETRSLPEKKLSSQSHTVPKLHIDIQIHISSDASPEQIDQIFASMAKHLYTRDLFDD